MDDTSPTGSDLPTGDGPADRPGSWTDPDASDAPVSAPVPQPSFEPYTGSAGPDPTVAPEGTPEPPAPLPLTGQSVPEPEPVEPDGDGALLTRRSTTRVAKKKAPPRSFARELPFLIVIAFALALLIKFFFFQLFFIPSGSMEQTLHVGDRVLVNKLVYDYRSPHRGEIIVFNGTGNFDVGDADAVVGQQTTGVQHVARKVAGWFGLGSGDGKDYIKRVIAGPGDRVMCCDEQGRVVVLPAGGGPALHLDEPYVFENDMTDKRYFCAASVTNQSASAQSICPPGAQGLLVPKGRVWVMGDHRGDSADSRFHITDGHEGTVPIDKIVGRAFTIVYPFGRAGLLHVPSTFSAAAAPALPWAAGGLVALPVTGLRRRRVRRKAR